MHIETQREFDKEFRQISELSSVNKTTAESQLSPICLQSEIENNLADELLESPDNFLFENDTYSSDSFY